jgi:uncharacterized repeat protein (TIGR01451 family)/fimbrial isopeptide formation D2 family protein
MEQLILLKNRLARGAKQFAFGLGLFSLAAGGGALNATATGTPAFNNISGDYSTLQVAKSGQAWGTSTTATPGDTLTMLVWDHQTSPSEVSHNTTIQVSLPSGVAASQSATATVRADNATPATGTVNIALTAPAKLTYIPGSATFYRNSGGNLTAVNWPTGVNADSVVTTGVNLGDQAGCWQYAQAVMIQVRVEGGNPAILTDKAVQLVGGTNPFGTDATANPGDELAFRIRLQNTGNGTGVNTAITDTLDSHLTYSAGSSLVYTKQNNSDVSTAIPDANIKFVGQTITWAWYDLTPNPESAIYLLFKARVKDGASFPVGQTCFTNKATSSFTGVSADTNVVNMCVTKAPAPIVNFQIRKEFTNRTLGDSKWYHDQSGSALPGDTVSYRLIIQNTGNMTANNVMVKDVLPAGIAFAGNIKLYNTANPNGVVISANSLVAGGYTFASIAAGTDNMQTLIFDAKVGDICGATFTNHAEVLYNNAKMAEDNASAIASCKRGLIITKSIQDTDGQYKSSIGNVHEGQTLTYEINVLNNGNVTAFNPVVRDVMPKFTTFVPGSLTIDNAYQAASTEQAFNGTGMVLTNLTPGLGKVIRFQVRVVDCPDYGNTVITNTAYVKANEIAEIASNAVTATVQVNLPKLIASF